MGAHDDEICTSLLGRTKDLVLRVPVEDEHGVQGLADACGPRLGTQALLSINLFGNAMENEGGAAVMKAPDYNFNILNLISSLSMGDNAFSDVHLRIRGGRKAG